MKTAFPMSYSSGITDPPRPVILWQKTMEEIYRNTPVLGWENSVKLATQDWSQNILQDFYDWMKYYMEGNHLKYKKAQYYLPQQALQMPEAVMKPALPPTAQEMDHRDRLQRAQMQQQFKDNVREKIKSIISRLLSAEKLATSPEIQAELHRMLPNGGLVRWLEQLSQLKREVQLTPIRSASLVESLIVKNANCLRRDGQKVGAIFLEKVAQTMIASPPASSPTGILPANPIDMGSMPGAGQPTAGMDDHPISSPPNPSDPISSTDGPEPDPAKNKAMQDFLKMLNGPGQDDGKAKDGVKKEAQVANNVPDASVQVPETVPVPEVVNEAPGATINVENNEPTSVDNTINKETEKTLSQSQNDDQNIIGNDIFENALKDVTLVDAISRLEGVAALFKHRQIARELSIADLMLNKLGLASFFPELGECSKSMLEAFSYGSSRISGILSKLHSIVNDPVVEQIKNNFAVPAEEAIAKSLQDQENKENLAKEFRKKEKDQDTLEQNQPPQTNQIQTLQQAKPQIQPIATQPIVTPPAI